MLPNFASIFETIDEYRYTIAIGLLLMCLVPFHFPVGWNTITPVWTFSAAALFSLSVARIFVVDAVPYLKKKFRDDDN